MCLFDVTTKENKKFIAKHGQDTTIRVWKVYDKWNNRLESPFRYVKVQSHGVVTSDRCCKRLNLKYDGDHKNDDINWRVYHGLHVFLDRESALNTANQRWGRVVVCCHAKISDFVACDGDGEAVFMKVTISPRNYRRALTGK